MRPKLYTDPMTRRTLRLPTALADKVDAYAEKYSMSANAAVIELLQHAVSGTLEALEALFDDYKQLADSGDAGNWALEDRDVGQRAIAAIAKARGAK